MMRKTARAALLLVLSTTVLGGAGCSSSEQGDTSAPVYLTLRPGTDLVDVLNIAVASGDRLRYPSLIIENKLKVPTGGTNALLSVKLDDYVVEWRRTDGGTKTPATEVFPLGNIVDVGGTLRYLNLSFMSIEAWQRSPFDQLYPFNGGIDRETGRSEIRLQAIVTFRGHTLSGQPVTGANNFDMSFVYRTTP